jgi:hypothetical protein
MRSSAEAAACYPGAAGTKAHSGQPPLAYLSPVLSHQLYCISFLAPSITSAMAIDYGVVVVGACAAIYASLRLLLHYTQDPREPRPLETLIPFVSPVIGMMRKKTNFYVLLRYCRLPCVRSRKRANFERIAINITFRYTPFVCPAHGFT